MEENFLLRMLTMHDVKDVGQHRDKALLRLLEQRNCLMLSCAMSLERNPRRLKAVINTHILSKFENSDALNERRFIRRIVEYLARYLENCLEQTAELGKGFKDQMGSKIQ